MKLLILSFISLLVPMAFAQFGGFFENMFGGGGGGHHQQHHQQRTAASQWAAYSDSVSCTQYLCPKTLDCVARPVDCPCPDAEDVKCLIPDADGTHDDGTVVCARGKNDCSEIERLMKKGAPQGKGR